MATLRVALSEAADRLSSAGVADAEREAAWLLAHVLGMSVGQMRTRSEEPAGAEELVRFLELVDRRARREPVQYILGTEEFMGLTLKVTPAVLIPRPDTVALVRAAAARLKGPVRIADVGTGSGAIALAMAALLPEAQVIATDISPEALAVAYENVRRHGMVDRVELRQGDLLLPLAGERLNAILSNPPYVAEAEFSGLMAEVRDWEPRVALTPGGDGLALFRRLTSEVPDLLKPGGFLGVEVGMGQMYQVRQLFEGAGLAVTVHRDGGGVERAVIGGHLS